MRLAAASAVVGTGCGGAASPAPFSDAAAGVASALAVGNVVALAGVPACIARDAQGVYAMTLTCTHAGCDMETQGNVSSAGIQCFCHGSEFDAEGNVVRGPAVDPLQHFAVSVDSKGNLTVHGGTPVGASTRLMV